jgi:tetratricopeptide (TPR) repeat protein
MGDAEGALRDYRDALTRAEAYRRDHPESWRIYVTLAHIYQGLGQKDEALAAARKCLALVPPEKNPYLANRTMRVLVNTQAQFGQLDEAMDIVRDQIEKGWWRRNDLLLNPGYSELQKDPRFRALAEKAPL